MSKGDLAVIRHPSGVSVSTLPQAFQQTAAVAPDSVAIRTVGNQAVLTWRQYADRVRRIAAGLAALGVERGHTVGIMLRNRPEFHLVDTAVLHLGAIPFSIYNTSAPDQIKYLFSNAENKVVFTEKDFLPAINAAVADLAHVIVIDADADADADAGMSLEQLESSGAKTDFNFDATWQSVRPDDIATLIYTSGTTGPPKGVELTHANVIAEFSAIVELLGMQPTDRITSYLPHAHVADRVTAHYANMVFGVQVTDVADVKAIAEALPDARPTLWLGVPRVWHKIQAGIETKLAEAGGARKRLALWAIDTGIRAARQTLSGKSLSPALAISHKIADRLVLAKVREALGLDQLRWGVTGAAAMPVETLEFFWGLGIPVYEVWGESECVGGATSNRRDAIKLGSVGKPLRGVEVKVAGDGELLIRGPIVMRGYRHQPEKTAEAIDADGWLYTGDIGTIDAQGFVTIVDRKKELLVNESGKNLSPSNIERAIQADCPLIDQVVAFGDARPYVTALVVLDRDTAAAQAAALGMADPSAAAFAQSRQAREMFTAAVREGNSKLSRVEQIKRFIIIGTAWDPGGDELTPTMKLKRKPIAQKYSTEIDKLYAATPGPEIVDLSKPD
ncbi:MULTISPECIES: AMP-dependent synthetase/ligase [Mycobacterium]|uniref:Acyl-CoA synthetase n=1 Tax=Mycobacterium pseudoshottsii TaxID=265949 RepID=A0A9N7LT86_9MYCO|nr:MULTISPECIES: long-chain fatty acid--CoA ligase [Mycobacterium]EPQ47053.1 Long-chain-fatty-acid--CoA ligase [Mycobacterium sp. 012931]BDN83178.1 fatty-acid--CoA ligase [Mycobacterium pseudoshottsii]BEH77565.1 fatty-acid--CoA ligase [Mycobacterium pseudoshottsii]